MIKEQRTLGNYQRLITPLRSIRANLKRTNFLQPKLKPVVLYSQMQAILMRDTFSTIISDYFPINNFTVSN